MLMFSELNRGGRTVILITHEDDIAAYAKRVVRLRDGLIIDDRRLAAVDAPPPVVGEITGEDRVFSGGATK
jgi:putative ABC transport system ATP-binding protein